MTMRWFPVLALAMAAMPMAPSATASSAIAAQSAESFRFETVNSIEDMHAFVREHFRVGTPAAELRRRFVAEGGATRIAHPSRQRVEKYLYDINLCDYYVWRWNISADFDAQDRLQQVYVNGEPMLADGEAERLFDPRTSRNPGATISRMSRPRPEAHRGESSLGFILADGDGNPRTIEDQRLFGGGPSRPHPVDMGRMRAYEVSLWRSIFDPDPAARIVPYSGDCAAAEAAMAQRTGAR